SRDWAGRPCMRPNSASNTPQQGRKWSSPPPCRPISQRSRRHSGPMIVRWRGWVEPAPASRLVPAGSVSYQSRNPPYICHSHLCALWTRFSSVTPDSGGSKEGATLAQSNLPVLSTEGGLGRYLQEIRKFPMLEPDEEFMLAKRYKEH